MAKIDSKRLVIDASIAQAAGGDKAVHPTSRACREFLSAVLKICHRFVLTPPIREEWKRHQSSYALKWQVQMYGKKKVDYLDYEENHSLREKVNGIKVSEKKKEAMLKDIHLIESALLADCAVASCDDTVRKLFADSATHIPELREIVWVNPANSGENCREWLNAGATVEKARLLI